MTIADLPARIAAKLLLDVETGCWLWMGARVKSGYGSCWWRGAARQAHRVVYHLLVRKVRRELDHRCRVRACCNPAHLEPVSRGENNRRSTCWHHLHRRAA